MKKINNPNNNLFIVTKFVTKKPTSEDEGLISCIG
jgi:hypothetical protein